jgi:hypothetical protein
MHGFLTVVGDINGTVTETLEEHDGDLLIKRLIFDKKDARRVLFGEAVSPGMGGGGNGTVRRLGDLGIMAGGSGAVAAMGWRPIKIGRLGQTSLWRWIWDSER